MAFSEKTESQVLEWLKEEGFQENVISIFEGMWYCSWLSYQFFFFSDNQVDGEGFLLLTDTDISEIIKAKGVMRKLVARRNQLNRRENLVSCSLL